MRGEAGLLGKTCLLIVIVFSSLACADREPGPRRIFENGEEVVLNSAEPFQVKGKPSVLRLEEDFSLDTEDNALAALGVTDIAAFDVDRSGNLLFLVPPSGPHDCVYKLAPDGKLLTTFCRVGQGPNEAEYPNEIMANDNGEIWVLESPKNRIHIFDEGGMPIAEKSPLQFESIVPLANGNHLVTRLDAADLTTKYFPMAIELYDPGFRLVKELDRFRGVANRTIYERVPEPYVSGIEYAFQGKASSERIYIGNSDRAYEILVFDLGGRLIRKIRKEFAPVPVTDAYRERYLKDYLAYMPDYAKKIYFPEYWHPFHAFFPDEEGRLFVMTYETCEPGKAFVYEVFDRDGRFISRTRLSAVHGGNGYLLARVRGKCLYAVEEKPSGFKRLNAYRMIWQ
jgi:hypothetical protein